MAQPNPVISVAPTRMRIVAWALLAAINLSAGVAISSWPERQSDLENVERWGHAWLVAGADVYGAGPNSPNYPPLAIVVLSPLGVLTARAAVPLWALFNLVLASLAAYLAIRAARPGAPVIEIALPILMFLTWGTFRTLLQFSLLSVTLGFAAQVLADRHPRWSGVCLGLALVKPHIGVPFLLWALFTRRLGPLLGATFVALGSTLLYCLRVWASPLSVVARYVGILGMFSSGEALDLKGVSHLRPLVADVVASPQTVDVIAVLISATFLIAICALGFEEGRRRPILMYSAPALAGIWSLMTFYHLTYGFVLLMPAATVLLWYETSGTRRARRAMFLLLQAVMMFDPPTMWRWLAPAVSLPRVTGAWLLDADRVMLIALAAAMTALAVSARRGWR